MSDIEIVVSLTTAIAGELGSAGCVGVGCGVGVATGFGGGWGVVRRLCPDASEKKVTIIKNETAFLDKVIFLIGARAPSPAKRCMIIRFFGKRRQPATAPAFSHLARELSHRLKRIDLVSVFIGPKANNAGKAQCESALMAL